MSDCQEIKNGCKVAKRCYEKWESADLDDGASKKKFRPFGGGPKPHAGEFRDELFQWFVDVHATCFFLWTTLL